MWQGADRSGPDQAYKNNVPAECTRQEARGRGRKGVGRSRREMGPLLGRFGPQTNMNGAKNGPKLPGTKARALGPVLTHSH